LTSRGAAPTNLTPFAREFSMSDLAKTIDAAFTTTN